MNKDQAIKIIKSHLPEKRFIHTMGVFETAIQLAEIYQVDEDKTAIAAIFHDYAKYHPIIEMKQIVKNENLDQRLIYYGDELLHGPVGAFLLEREFGLKDEEILNGIRYHTTGRPEMSMLEKIIFIADYIEPGRSFAGLEEVREVVKKDLNAAIIIAIKNTVQFLISKNKLIFPDTIETYNSLIKRR